MALRLLSADHSADITVFFFTNHLAGRTVTVTAALPPPPPPANVAMLQSELARLKAQMAAILEDPNSSTKLMPSLMYALLNLCLWFCGLLIARAIICRDMDTSSDNLLPPPLLPAAPAETSTTPAPRIGIAMLLGAWMHAGDYAFMIAPLCECRRVAGGTAASAARSDDEQHCGERQRAGAGAAQHHERAAR